MIPNDADLEMARLTDIANGLSNARRAGHCSHESRQGDGDPWNPSGKSKCTDCGKEGTWESLDEDRNEIIMEWT